MIRRDRMLIVLSSAGLFGVLALLGAIAWLTWTESVSTEELRVGALARELGKEVESEIVGARDMLADLNDLDAERCSQEHLDAMQAAAIAKPHIRAIGFWNGTQRICGIGFVRGTQLIPRRADKIYESGVVAWWPSEQTRIGDVEFFLMRYGAHDVAIDPRLLLDTGIIERRSAGLWVEGLPMTHHPDDARLPEPGTLKAGLTVDQENRRILSRFSLGTIVPIDIVAAEPIGSFWNRYLPAMATAAIAGLLLTIIWLYFVYRFTRHQLSLSAELRAAIAHNRLKVHYQPVIDLATGECVGAEALVRWRRESGGLVSPEVFIPVAEEAGLISEVTHAVLRAIIRDLGNVLREASDISINLNLARQDLESPKLLDALARELGQSGIPASSIKLEITERALINSDAARQLIRDLRTRGHRVAIDDFGTGYSSLAYLETFEIDTLKIDKSFVDAIETDAVTSNVITHVIEMAHSLELDTVAEGIEEAHQVDWLKRQGVTHGQGFYYSKPLTARRFLRFYRNQLPQI